MAVLEFSLKELVEEVGHFVVCGLYVGLILSQNPGATLSQVRNVIRDNAVDILDPNGSRNHHIDPSSPLLG